jgi:hypothetical protein
MVGNASLTVTLTESTTRSNIGNARVAGLQSDLGLSDHQYQTGEHLL